MANRAGIVAYAITRDDAGRPVRVERQDSEGNPATVNDVTATVVEYDAAGNPFRTSQLGPEGKPARNYKDWIAQEIGFDDLGEVIVAKYFRLGTDDKLAPGGEWSAVYDSNGYPTEVKFVDQQSYRYGLQFDDHGNLLEEKSIDDAGRPVVNDKGYAIKRLSYKFGADGVFWDERYFDAAGAKTYCSAGYHRLTNQFGATGVLQRQTMEELDHSRFQYERDVSEPEYDALGRQRRNVFRHENDKDELALDAGLPYAQREENYDENGRVFLIWELGCPASAGAPAFSTDLEYHKTGAQKRRIRQACDMNRKPLTLTSTGIAAHIEEEFDQLERRERIYETGFNEKTVGFATREAKYSDGAFRSVTHKRSDGSMVATVRVFIVDVAAQQAKAAELRAGDQLLEANGALVHSAYEFTATTFPGGWIEVMRDGKRVRIEGFEAGPLGVALEDRAVTNP
jgi:hypothetical protein